MNRKEWYELHNCNHAHCPNECEHPQPFMVDNERFICGKCIFESNKLVEMIPCNSELCD